MTGSSLIEDTIEFPPELSPECILVGGTGDEPLFKISEN